VFVTDKVTVHGYYPAYEQLAAGLGSAARVCELGVLDGESLAMWQYLFPDGEITGVDVNPHCRWPDGTRKVVASHDDPGLPALLGGPFDLIVDDGCHQGEVVTRSFTLLWPLVAPGGRYVIEDWMVSLRAACRPGETWGESWGTSMLRAVEKLLLLLDDPDAECEAVEYRYGLAIARKRNGA
jgi:Methyltransferase domain